MVKYYDIWKKTKNTLDIRFHRNPVYDEKYIKTKIKVFNCVINTYQNFSDHTIPKERVHYICIAAINIDSVIKIDKKKKKTILKFI